MKEKDAMMREDLTALPFSAADLTAIVAWSQRAAQRGISTDMESNETFPDLLFVTLPGGDDAAFTVWRTLGSTYCMEDVRQVGTVVTCATSATVDAALDAVYASLAASGRSGLVAPPALDPTGRA